MNRDLRILDQTNDGCVRPIVVLVPVLCCRQGRSVPLRSSVRDVRLFFGHPGLPPRAFLLRPSGSSVGVLLSPPVSDFVWPAPPEPSAPLISRVVVFGLRAADPAGR